jgi:hypothetical protein
MKKYNSVHNSHQKKSTFLKIKKPTIMSDPKSTEHVIMKEQDQSKPPGWFTELLAQNPTPWIEELIHSGRLIIQKEQVQPRRCICSPVCLPPQIPNRCVLRDQSVKDRHNRKEGFSYCDEDSDEDLGFSLFD